jgi:hypothetical protein
MKCIAYVRSGRTGNAWKLCTRRAVAECVFCAGHRDAANGAVLGFLVKGYPERATRPATADDDPAAKVPAKKQ